MDFNKLNQQMKPLDRAAMEQAQARWNNVAKPVGSLGVLEDAVVRLAGILGTADVAIDKRALVVMCADNGVLAQGVAQTPGEITGVMSTFIAQHRSSVCIMAKYANVDVFTVDVGILHKLEIPEIIDRHVMDGTRDMTQGPAMTAKEAEAAIRAGMELVREKVEQGYRIFCTGEMGIGNTTTSSAIAAVLLSREVEEVTGRGAGLSDEGLNRKISAIKRALAKNQPDPNDAFDVLCKVGGLDIAGMAGMFLGGALYGVPVVIDGFISAVSALVARRLCPNAYACMMPSHMSAEPAALMIQSELGFSPVIHAGMRLGEGTGAVAVLPLLDMAVRVYHDLMTFADIGM